MPFSYTVFLWIKLLTYYRLICLSVGYIECFVNDVFTEFCLLKTLP